MDWTSFAGASWFLLGVCLGAVMLGMGVLVGMLMARRTETAMPPTEWKQVFELMQGLSEWTSGVAQEVEQYQQVIEGVTRHMRAEGASGGSTLPAAPAAWFRQLVDANQHLRQRLQEAEATLQRQAGELAEYVSAARTDALTELPNRRAFDDELRRRYAEWCRFGQPFSVLLVDIDHFKSLNDHYGHLAGDKVLVEVARVLARAMRESGLVVRFGGEEFAAVLPATDADEARRLAERVRRAVQQGRYVHENRTLHVTVSCGVAHATPGDTIEAMLQRADAELYASKNAGRNFAHWHNGCHSVPITRPEVRSADVPSELAELDTLEQHREFPKICTDLRQRLREITGA